MKKSFVILILVLILISLLSAFVNAGCPCRMKASCSGGWECKTGPSCTGGYACEGGPVCAYCDGRCCGNTITDPICRGGDDDDDGPPPPPPPPSARCGDTVFQAATDKACEYGANPPVFSNNGAYTGSVCLTNGQACRASGADVCTCCGDTVRQTAEACDLGIINGNDTNRDGVIGTGECRKDCTLCGDGVVQGSPATPPGGRTLPPLEACDLGTNNGVDLNRDGYFGAGECRRDCSFCGDGKKQAGEFCDPIITCPIMRTVQCVQAPCPQIPDCTKDNYALWKDSGYYPGCRQDCTACGDGLFQNGETCDDVRPFESQLHTSFSNATNATYYDTCPGACTQPGWISGDTQGQCGCKPEICDQRDNNGRCSHCAANRNNQPYFSQLCSGSTSLWKLDIDKNKNNVACDCCKCCTAGETGPNCCGSGICQANQQFVCDDGVDDGFAWQIVTKAPLLSAAVMTNSSTVSTGGLNVFSALSNCYDNTTSKVSEFPKYVYLTWNTILTQMFNRTVPNTQTLDALEFSMIYKTASAKITVEWKDIRTNTWKPFTGCGPFESGIKESIKCKLPAELKNIVQNTTIVNSDTVMIRLVVNKKEGV